MRFLTDENHVLHQKYLRETILPDAENYLFVGFLKVIDRNLTPLMSF